MPPRHPSRRAVAAQAFAIVLAITAPATAQAPPAAPAQSDSYKLHMENGVKLVADKNYVAAIAEFQAAYEARPNANPLLNIAICNKELYRYPQAIAALETALAKHGATMDPTDKKVAEDAIREMRALLGTVSVTVKPEGAILIVDGEELPAGAASKPVPLGPGVHKIAAKADGYATAEQSVTIASGRDQQITFALVAEKGLVTVQAPNARMTIAIDDQPMGVGTWSGMLSPGSHTVSMYGPEGQPYAMAIAVQPGVPLLVGKGVGGVPLPPPKKDDPGPQRRGFYVLGIGSVLFPIAHPPAFPEPKPDFGAGYGLRAGYQVNRTAGFELTYEHSSITTTRQGDTDTYYRIIANRIAPTLRLISPGRTVRFVGSFGGGLVIDEVQFTFSKPGFTACEQKKSPCPLATSNMEGHHVFGVDAFALVEVGLEIDIDRVLLDFVAEGEFQSTGNLTTDTAAKNAVFESKALINVGPAVRVGYRFW